MKSSTLLALTASALALPGLDASADAPPTTATVAYRFTSYQEDDLAADKVQFSTTQRYDITVNQLQWTTPVSDNYSLALTGSRDSMSGASPWYTVQLYPSGNAGVVMSGATIHEQRNDLTASGRRYFDNGSLGVSLGRSTENDYRSWSGGFDGER
ncbi:MAG TPA: DUF3570 domain-containing protein, partial [Candidatus Acidoferrum sp.]|nr:DUF3570 domain-containing protein [Candidatus Acidoferrum sp.]